MANGVIHIRDIRAIRVQYLSREKFDGTRISRITRILCNLIYPHSPYSCYSCSTYITRNIWMEHKYHASPEFFTIAIHPHSCYSCNPCSIYFTHINSIEYELHGCVLKGRAQCHSQCHSQCLTHYYYYLCPPHPHCIIKTFRYLSISFFTKIIIQFITYTLQNNH